MPKKSTSVKANNYIYVSFPCEDNRLRYPTGVKDSESETKSGGKKIRKIQELIDNYSIQYDLIVKPILKSALKSYLDKEIKPEKMKALIGRSLVNDHIYMIEKMRSGDLVEKKSKGRYSDDTIAQYLRMRNRWEECAADPKTWPHY